MEYALIVKHLKKSYGDVKAVNDISFEVKKGSLFAFLGINGAGKSTTINIICSILSKDDGEIILEGYDLDKDREKIKNLIGFVFQSSVLDDKLSVYDNLRFRTKFYGMSKEEEKNNINRIIKLLDLEPILNRPIKNLSGGQKRRVDIARAIVHYPKFLILDEPTTGLDPKTRELVWELIDHIRIETGMTVFLTTHYLEEADQASDVVIMDKGNIIAKGTPVELKNQYSSDYIISYQEKNVEFEGLLTQNNIKFKFNEEKNLYMIHVKDTKEAKEIINKFDNYLEDIEIKKGDMDDVFLNVTGRDMKDHE